MVGVHELHLECGSFGTQIVVHMEYSFSGGSSSVPKEKVEGEMDLEKIAATLTLNVSRWKRHCYQHVVL